MWKYFLITVMALAGVYWQVLGFFIAWAAADGAEPFLAVVRDELNGPNPGYMQLWVLISLFHAVFLVLGLLLLPFVLVSQWKKRRKK